MTYGSHCIRFVDLDTTWFYGGEETAVSVLRLMSLRTELLSVALIGILVVHVMLLGCSALLMM